MNIVQLKKERNAVFASAVVFLIPVSALATTFGPTPLQLLILLACGWSALNKNRYFPENDFRIPVWVVTGFAGYFLISLVRALWIDHALYLVDGPSRLLLALSCIVFVVAFRPRVQWFFYGVCVAAISAGGIALYQWYKLSLWRPPGLNHHAITFGDLAMVTSVMAICTLLASRKKAVAFLVVPAMAFGMTASILSGTRGAWLGLLLALLPLLFYRRAFGNKAVMYIMASVIAIFTLAYFMPFTSLSARMAEIITDTGNYLLHRNVSTSGGIRLELWKASWYMFSDHPLIGVGRDQFQTQLQLLAQQGRLQPQSPALGFSSSHNDMLHFLATGGLVDFSLLMLIYFAPMAFFIRVMRTSTAEHRSAALAGILLITCFIGFGLTDVMFWLMQPKVFYAMTVCTLIGFCLVREGHEAVNPLQGKCARVPASERV